MRRFFPLALNIGMCLIATIFMLIVADGVAALVLSHRAEKLSAQIVTTEELKNASQYLSLFEYHPILGFDIKPNSSAIGITHSASRTRSRFHAQEKEPGVYRVAVFGDSQVWGWSVKDHETIPEYLSKCLNLAGKGRRYEVINFGVVSYSLDQTLLKFLIEAPRFHPDSVALLIFPENDIGELTLDRANGLPKPIFWLEDEELRYSNVPVPRSVSWTMQHNPGEGRLHYQFSPSLSLANLSLLFDTAAPPTLARLRSGSQFLSPASSSLIPRYLKEPRATPPKLSSTFESGLPVAVAMTRLMAEASHDLGAQFTPYLKPLESELREGIWHPQTQSIIRAFDGTQPIIELFSRLRTSGIDPANLLLPYGHLSAAGNEIVANEMCRRILIESAKLKNFEH